MTLNGGSISYVRLLPCVGQELKEDRVESYRVRDTQSPKVSREKARAGEAKSWVVARWRGGKVQGMTGWNFRAWWRQG